MGSSGARHWVVYGLGGVLLTTLYLVRWDHGLAGNILYDSAGLSAVIAIVIGVRRHEPRNRLAWHLLALGQLLFVAGDVLWAVYQLILHVAIPFPSPADGLYLAGYPAITAAVLLFVRERSSGRDRASLVDTAMVTTTVGVYVWVFLMEPYATDPSLSLAERLISIAYPLGDLAILTVVARLIISVTPRVFSYAALVASFLLLLVADAIFAYQALAGTYEVALTTDGFWMLGYVLTGCAALHPSMHALTEPAEEAQQASRARLRLLVLSAALLLMPGVLGVQSLLGQPPDVRLVLVGSAALALLVLTRMIGLVRQVEGKVQLLEAQEAALRAALTEGEALSDQLKYQAFHDVLTGVANRQLFADRLDHALARRTRSREPLALLFLDVDDFKSVNDALGHATGDALLIAVSRCLERCLRPEDTVARIGGDEFAVLLEGADHEVAAAVAARIVAELSVPLEAAGKLVAVRASIGITVDTNGQDDADALLRKADIAMYEAKRSGKNRLQVFDPSMHTAVLESQHMKADLERALRNAELTNYYQPIVELETGRVVAAETLVRWLHPQRGLVLPGEFIPRAEESALIRDVERYVLQESLRQVTLWRQRHESADQFRVSVNISPLHLQRFQLSEEIGALLERFGLPGEALVVEITETALLQYSDALLDRLNALKELGVGIALDDFGTGFSSLAHLRRLPIDVLKIDKSFIDDLGRGHREAALAHAINSLGKRLGLTTVAEGVERRDQVDQLQAIGCELAQGFLFGRPEPPDEMDAILAHMVGRRPLLDHRP